jgi:predicted lipoprotein with Yx(FWY)xxD motif
VPQSLNRVRSYLFVPATAPVLVCHSYLIVTEVLVKLTSSRTALAALAVSLLGAAAACGDDDDSSSDTTSAAASATTAAPADTAAATTAAGTDTTEAVTETTGAGTTEGATGGGETTVAAAESDLGTILVDGEGLTLYMFNPDAQGAPTCVDNCAQAWPALAGPATAGDGVDESLLGTATRPDDNSEQVTYNGWPLYYFAEDAAPGDTNGQGVGDNWYVVDATTGEPIQ